MKTTYTKYLLAVLLFGTNGIVASMIQLSSYEIVFLRALIGSLLLLAIFKFTKQKFTFMKHKKQFLYLIISGVALGAGWIFLYEAYQQIGVSVASLAYYCGPVIVMALSPLLFKERLTPIKILGFASVILGIIFVNGQVMMTANNPFGIFCGAMSAVLFAVMVIANKKSKPIVGLENSMLQLLISFATVAVFMFCKQGFVIQISKGSIIPILVLGIVNTGLGCYMYFSSMTKLPIQTVSVLGYIEPLAAVVFSAFILNEAMAGMQLVGAALILGGAVFTECSGLLTKITKLTHKYRVGWNSI